MGLTPENIQSILAEYDRKRELLADFAKGLERLLNQLLRQPVLSIPRVLMIDVRVKTRGSLEGKLARSRANYRSLADVTDVVGARVITKFPDEVDQIGALIEGDFAIDRGKSVDKRAALAPDRFGYQSLHFIVTVNAPRAALREYARYAGLPAEIQIRTALQHAWAEAEHGLIYKRASAAPSEIRRRISRLAGLLEIADTEFQSIRDDLEPGNESESEPANAGPPLTEASLVGTWQNSRGVAAGYSVCWCFFSNMDYHFHSSQMDYLTRRRMERGKWGLDGSRIRLEAVSETFMEGGVLEDSPPFGPHYAGAEYVETAIQPPRTRLLDVASGPIANEDSPYDEIRVDSRPYWRLFGGPGLPDQ